MSLKYYGFLLVVILYCQIISSAFDIKAKGRRKINHVSQKVKLIIFALGMLLIY